jgi:hypothetical protein
MPLSAGQQNADDWYMKKTTVSGPTGSKTTRPDESKTILVADPAHPDRLLLRTNSWWLRAMARLMAGTLDRKLASGAPPESKPVLAARASRLVEPDTLGSLVRDWRGLVDRAHRVPATTSLRPIPIRREQVIEAEGSIETMLGRLANGVPSPARGVAMAIGLLKDGTGPVYNRGAEMDLCSAVQRATSYLDPTLSLTSAA